MSGQNHHREAFPLLSLTCGHSLKMVLAVEYYIFSGKLVFVGLNQSLRQEMGSKN